MPALSDLMVFGSCSLEQNFAPCMKEVTKVCIGEDSENYTFCSGIEKLKQMHPNEPHDFLHLVEVCERSIVPPRVAVSCWFMADEPRAAMVQRGYSEGLRRVRCVSA